MKTMKSLQKKNTKETSNNRVQVCTIQKVNMQKLRLQNSCGKEIAVNEKEKFILHKAAKANGFVWKVW